MGNKKSKEKHNKAMQKVEEHKAGPGKGKSESQKVQFSMSCYWTGEATLGALPGVIATQAGSCSGHFETVLVTYDPRVTNPQKLQAKCRFHLVKGNPTFHSARTSQQKYYLQNTKGLSHLVAELRKGGTVAGSHTYAAQMNALVGGYGSPEVLKAVTKNARLTTSEAKVLARYYEARRQQ
mmetsp:Transcript_33878/g.65937  ORF Transcript_33878/g.65937 Transcript_33878/m.65937 type:complete len:180 (-) Transcript_33878:233-772(-)